MSIADEIINITTQLMLTSDKSEVLRIAAQLNAVAANAMDKADPDKRKTTTEFLKFTQKEISKMPKTFRKEFIAAGAVAHIIKRPSGKHTYCYEIRYRRNGFNITASSTSVEKAKAKFIEKITSAINDETEDVIPFFENIAEEWFACRKPNIHTDTYKTYYSYYRRYILPYLSGRRIDEIRSNEFIPVMEQVKGKGRAYEDMRSILNQIFKYAIANGIISHNPVTFVEFIHAERKNGGQALSFDEINLLLKRLSEPVFDKYREALMLELFFGLRPCEVETAVIDGDFIMARNAKRKKGKIEYKRIPFSSTTKKYIRALPKKLSVGRLNSLFQKIFPDKTQYYLRHTFSTVCQMYVRQEIVNIWLGDSPEKLIGKTYTHFPDEFMLYEMSKVNFEEFVPQNVPHKTEK